ncbi:MAG: DUF3185 family protein [Gammaproteobacteria bacterium]|jgi:uncharacterized protein YjeT (DUF2065 family)|nr:DUF3185 family protein [Gammaproteobacteria bacterium]
MANGSNVTLRVVGLALLVVGIGLALWGYQLSESVGSQVTEALTGAESDKIMALYISGAVSFVVGLFLIK